MPADALNLINHMKLHVNGKMAEDDDDDDRRKEQESAEAISGLKIFYVAAYTYRGLKSESL